MSAPTDSGTEPRGTLMYTACYECENHYLAYSLEPTPDRCPDCANKLRKDIMQIRDSISFVSIDGIVCEDDDLGYPEAVQTALNQAQAHRDAAEAELDEAVLVLDQLLRTIPEVPTLRRSA